MSQYTEIEELEGVIAPQDLLDFHWWSSLRRATTTDTSKWGTRVESPETKDKFKYNTRSPANAEKQVCPVLFQLRSEHFLFHVKL